MQIKTGVADAILLLWQADYEPQACLCNKKQFIAVPQAQVTLPRAPPDSY